MKNLQKFMAHSYSNDQFFNLYKQSKNEEIYDINLNFEELKILSQMKASYFEPYFNILKQNKLEEFEKKYEFLKIEMKEDWNFIKNEFLIKMRIENSNLDFQDIFEYKLIENVLSQINNFYYFECFKLNIEFHCLRLNNPHIFSTHYHFASKQLCNELKHYLIYIHLNTHRYEKILLNTYDYSRIKKFILQKVHPRTQLYQDLVGLGAVAPK